MDAVQLHILTLVNKVASNCGLSPLDTNASIGGYHERYLVVVFSPRNESDPRQPKFHNLLNAVNARRGAKVDSGIQQFIGSKMRGPDIVTMLEEADRETEPLRATTPVVVTSASVDTFDVFLCYNSRDRDSVRVLYEGLKKCALSPWFDQEHLRPGVPWQQELQRTIPSIKSAIVVVGPNGQGPWQEIEINAFLQEFAKRGCPVIPVLLADATATPALPPFLQAFTWVDFRRQEPDPWKRLA